MVSVMMIRYEIKCVGAGRGGAEHNNNDNNHNTKNNDGSSS